MADFSPLIRKWYRQNKRDLPWRSTNDPYKIWLSEIILQQTRVDQGLSYYLKFVEHYPSVDDMANATEEDLLNDWQGLGYYSRARNMHAAAKTISENLQGEFPDDYQGILNLKGVGTYTASAISSFAFNLPYAVVDGNVYRVLSRYFDEAMPIDSTKGTKLFQQLADALLDNNPPGEHNQAIMELGALICLPKNPKCAECPLSDSCLALKNGTITERPVKSKKTKVRTRYFHYFIVKNNGQTFIVKRDEKDIWQNMYQFPLIETEKAELPDDLTLYIDSSPIHKIHILSHQKIHAYFYEVSEVPSAIITNNLIPVSFDEIQNYPIPRLIDSYLESHPLNI